jgi:hypothetical protein
MKQENTVRQPYKYRLHYLLNRLPKEDYDIAMKFFPERLNIHPQTFRNWIYTTDDASREIPGNAIVVIAQFFEIPAVELYTTPPVSENEFKTQPYENNNAQQN